MKLQYGMRYITADDEITGRLKVNDRNALAYPFYDDLNGRTYAEDGRCGNGIDGHKITGVYYSPIEERCFQELPYTVDTVTISRKDYDRLKEIESAYKEIYEFAKRL